MPRHAKSWFSRLRNGLSLWPRRTSRPPRSERRLEHLESRQLMAADILELHSYSGAPKSLYLDFDGHYEECGYEEDLGFLDWCGAYPDFLADETFEEVSTPAFRGTSADVQEIWQRVAEDFAPFNIDVTTVNPGNFANGQGMRIAIGGSWQDWYGEPAGGVASSIGSFFNEYSNTAWAFDHQPGIALYDNGFLADTISHEAGHTFGLEHQSLFASGKVAEYRPGDPLRGPLMGNSDHSDRSLWAIGTSSSGPIQDDVAKLAGALGYRADDHIDALDVNQQPLGAGGIVYDGVSPITAMIPYHGGVLTAFTNVENKPHLNRVHWSPHASNPGTGPIVYEGVSPVTAMVEYRGGVLTAFANAAENTSLNRIHWSPNGEHLGEGPIRYEGISPVTAIATYQGGLLTAFSNVEGNPQLHRVHWSPDGERLGEGSIRYQGGSPVEAIAAYEQGVLTAFSNAGPNGHRIHWSENGDDLGGGPIRYDGHSPVTSMIAHNGGMLTAFTHAGSGNRIHWSSNGQDLGGGPIRYEGVSPVLAMVSYEGGVLTAFTNVEGDSSRNRIHASLPTRLQPSAEGWRGSGVIATTTDRDLFRFTATAGWYDVRAKVAANGPNLALRMEVYDSDNHLVSSIDSSSLNASSHIYLNDAAYRIVVASHGEYGDLGQYALTAARSTSQQAEAALPGDTNADGRVDIVDLNNVRNTFGQTGGIAMGDANRDGVVDINDLNLVRNGFGTSSEQPLSNSTPAATRLAPLAHVSSAKYHTTAPRNRRDSGAIERQQVNRVTVATRTPRTSIDLDAWDLAISSIVDVAE